MYRKGYEDPEMEVVLFDTLDIVTESGLGDGDENEFDCGSEDRG